MPVSRLCLPVALIVIASPCAVAASQPPDPKGEALVRQYCVSCHPIETVFTKARSEDEWTELLYRMIDHGLNAPPEDLNAILSYLASHESSPGQSPAGH